MELAHLRAFVAIAHEGNLTRAAQRLHLTQPAVSLQVKALQEALRLTLFARTAHGLTLTRDGQALLPLAQRMLTALTDFQQAAGALRETVRGRLRIGTILDPEFTRLGAFLRRLVESYPQIETALRHSMSGSVLQQLARSELDVGFYIGHPDPARFHAVTLTPFSYQVLAPAGWRERVAGRAWRELAALPWIWTPRESAHNRLLCAVFDHAGVSPVKVAEVDQEPSMLDLVKSGLGLSLVRDSIALREARAHGLVIAEAVSVPTELTFVTLAARREEPAIAAALQLVAGVWA
ncbi:LysR family transcriptional regulator [Pandoraea faecigallinarum]|uniref:LysR family transcriptional regulator n=1 Tax=Pandoraea faecigallinarum TaxID=656179 RepID=A0A0H3WRZ5_9BURK|nr:LysR family transcriptional regulator [Pandoraea faecigallinarum]AKM30562.1 LysR family transcriptional regulator [Pandoraea faecigallinarum]